MLIPISQEVLDNLGEEGSNLFIEVLESIPRTQAQESKLLFPPDGMIFEPNGSISWRSDRGYGAPASIDQAFFIFNKLLQTTMSNSKLSWAKDPEAVKFVKHGNEEEMETPCIIWKVITGEPGAFGRGPQGSPTHTQRKPVYREKLIDPNDQNSTLVIYSQRFDYVVELSIKAQRANEADEIREWVENTVNQNLWYFKYSGLDEMLFSDRLSDTYEKNGAKNIFSRPLRYFISTQKLSWTSTQNLRDLVFTLTLEK